MQTGSNEPSLHASLGHHPRQTPGAHGIILLLIPMKFLENPGSQAILVCFERLGPCGSIVQVSFETWDPPLPSKFCQAQNLHPLGGGVLVLFRVRNKPACRAGGIVSPSTATTLTVPVTSSALPRRYCILRAQRDLHPNLNIHLSTVVVGVVVGMEEEPGHRVGIASSPNHSLPLQHPTGRQSEDSALERCLTATGSENQSAPSRGS